MTELENRGLSRRQAVIVGAVLALGVALRLRVYLDNRSLWLDEALLALNLIERDLAGLVRPLAHDQAAPLGFLFVERMMVVLFGASEYALRAFPLVAGIATLFVFWRLASALLLPLGATMALAALALSERLIYYATEVKQYGVDAGMTVVLWTFFLALEPRLRKNNAAAWAAAAATGALAIWLSHPAVFVLGAIGLRWLWHTVRPFSWRSVLVRGPAALTWGGSFALSYIVSLRQIDEATRLHEAWSGAAAPIVPGSGANVMWYVRFVWTLGAVPFEPAMAKVVAVACVVGLAVLWWRHRDQFWWATGAAALAVLASALGQYPLTGRLWLFLAPITILIVGAAVDELWRRSRARLALLAPAVAVAMLAFPAVTAARLGVQPPQKEEIRPVLHYIRAHYRDGDRLYLYPSAARPAAFYAARGLGFPGEIVVAVRATGERSAFERDAEGLRGKGRTWVLFSHVRKRGPLDDEALMLEALDRIGVRLQERRETGASAYLYAL
jgi:hypothetical protein